MALVNDEPPQLGSLYREDQMWDAYDGEDQDLRRARWPAITARRWCGHPDPG
jgi:hypothetical protein